MIQQKNKCSFCSEPFESMTGDVAELVQMIPLPPINLTTGEKGVAEPPYYAIRVLWMADGDDIEEEYIPIRYCPMCGRKLDETERGENGFGSTGR